MHIGIDFDNTIVDYDAVFHAYAVREKLISPNVKKQKHIVRKEIQKTPDGNTKWTLLQGKIYGEHILEAKAATGIKMFLYECKTRKIPVTIISHKTTYPAIGPPVNLRNASFNWLAHKGFFRQFGITKEQVFFENTIEDKIARIKVSGCTYFIDDLSLILTHAAFPQHVHRILYSKEPQNKPTADLHFAGNWIGIHRHIFGVGDGQSMKNQLQKLLKKPVRKVIAVQGGFNARVYKATDSKSISYFVKSYRVREDARERLRREFTSLSFLWQNGIRMIPEPVAQSTPQALGVYRFVNGTAYESNTITDKDLRKAISFWKSLHALVQIPEAKTLPAAKEASFTMRSYLRYTRERIEKLQKLPHKGANIPLQTFLVTEVKPFYQEIARWVKTRMDQEVMSVILPQEYRTLSPSDFGFHNAIRTPSGEIIFTDFEYFGWDDPAKLIADFCLHPRMKLTKSMQDYFYREVYTTVADPKLPSRLPLIYMLLGIKWCLIMLNVYLRDQENLDTTKATQLAKARAYLRQRQDEYAHKVFPISLTK